MWNEQQQFLNSQLSPNENLLWSGQPRQGVLLRAADAYLIPFSLMWCGFAIFWESTVWISDAPIFFRLWGIPFVLVGLYMVIGRFIVDSLQRSKTFYGVTNERIIIVSGISGRNVKSLNLRTLTDITLNEKPGGVGTITFGSAVSTSWQSNFPFSRRVEPDCPLFEGIPSAKNVYEIIRQAQKTQP